MEVTIAGVPVTEDDGKDDSAESSQEDTDSQEEAGNKQDAETQIETEEANLGEDGSINLRLPKGFVEYEGEEGLFVCEKYPEEIFNEPLVLLVTFNRYSPPFVIIEK
jgi:hypothetical protein